ncbi:MAG: RdgB/HAM1 family non-canonical purine NTP pyrophosphatase [Candidatus Nanopelagicus sp.]
MSQIVLATKNQGKILEFQRLLSKHVSEVKVLGLSDFPDLPDVEESGKTLSENAKLKAKSISDFTNLPALADDSGLFIDALNSDPGILSARWGGYQGSDSSIRDQVNISKVLEQLKDIAPADRSAQFKAVVYFYMKKSDGEIVEKEELGVLTGIIITEPRGSGGFGYDPIFMPLGFDKTLAEISPEVKDEVSHRGIAMRAMATFLLSNL